VMQQIIAQNNLPKSYEGLEQAYALGVMRGAIAPPPQMVQAFQQQAQQNPQWGNQFGQPQVPPMYAQNPYGSQGPYAPPPQGFAPPPRPGRGNSAPAENIASIAEGMTPEQIEQVFARFQ